MTSYFEILSEENATVLFKLIKQKAYNLKVEESFEWFEYIKNHPNKAWNFDLMCANPNVTWELIHDFSCIFTDYN